MTGSRMWAQHQLLGVPDEGQLFVLLHCAKVGLGGRCYENSSTIFSLGVRGQRKKKSFFQNVQICFLKIGLWKKHFPKVLRQKQHFKKLPEEWVPPSRLFLFRHLHGKNWTWKSAKFPHVFLVLRVHKKWTIKWP